MRHRFRVCWMNVASDPLDPAPTAGNWAVTRLSWLLATVAAGWGFFALSYAPLGRWRTAALDLGLTVLHLFLRAWLLQQPSDRRATWTAHLSVAASGLGLFVAALLSGQSQAMAHWYLVAIPLFAGYTLTLRATILWSAVALVLAAAVHLSELSARIDPEFVPDSAERLVGVGGLIVVVLGFAIAGRRAMAMHVAAVERNAAIIRAQSAELEERARVLEAVHSAAIAASHAKTAFMAMVSHELRTPLQGVIATAELLDPDGEVTEQRELRETLLDSCQALLSTSSDFLDLAKIEAGKLGMVRAPVDVHACTRSVAALFAASARRKSIRLGCEIAPGCPSQVLGDETRIRQILGNLVGNAVKFTREGSVEIKLQHLTADRGQRLRWTVQDTGIGISPENQEHLFEPYSQVAVDGRSGGTGLGLALVRALAAEMRAEVSVRSVLGVGSTFQLELDLVAVLAVGPAPAAGKAAPEEDRDITRLRILVADDNPNNRAIIGRMLERLKCSCDMVNDGAAAVLKARERPYDVVMMDLQMPELDGRSAAAQIRLLELAHQPRIVAMTANAYTEEWAACREAGMDDFVTKPMTISMLREALERSCTVG